jgi:chromate transporter
MTERPIGLEQIVRVFLKIGALSYGGPAIIGIMQAELQEKRNWITKQQFVDGLALVNMLPGPVATQLGIFIGHARGGMAGGIVAGICFILPAFFIMLALASAYAAYGALPSMRDAFYGIGPVVIGIFAAAVYKLGKGTVRDRAQTAVALAAGLAILLTPFDLVAVLLAAGCLGIMLFDSRRKGLLALLVVIAFCAFYYDLDEIGDVSLTVMAASPQSAAGVPPRLEELGVFFFKVGAFTFGGGLSLLAFIEEQVVRQLGWLTPQEFVDGLALGQLTPGPVLMLAAFIGFKTAGIKGALVAATAIFLPSFLMMLSILPLLKRMKDLHWLKAFMRGVGPAVIGALAVSLVQLAPHAARDVLTWGLLVGTIAIVIWRNIGPLPLLAGGAAIGLLAAIPVFDRFRELVP